MKTSIVIDILPQIPYLAKLCFSSYGPKSVGKSNCRTLENVISQERSEIMRFIFEMQINIKVSTSFLHFGFVQPGMPKVPKIEVCIFLHYL